jgi:hypothetical protein
MNISRYENIDKFVNIRYIFLLARRPYSWLFQLPQMWKLLVPGVGIMDFLTPVFIVIAHWNNSPWVDMSLHSDTSFWFQANQSLLFLLNASCLAEKLQIPILVFGLTRLGLEPTIYRIRGEHSNHYATDVVNLYEEKIKLRYADNHNFVFQMQTCIQI